ncbi:MAG: hypothetical protein Q4C82_09660, partial [Eubacteriales bacterium]|nr:hypothetical protein [Eubacteriales bacterium]
IEVLHGGPPGNRAKPCHRDGAKRNRGAARRPGGKLGEALSPRCLPGVSNFKMSNPVDNIRLKNVGKGNKIEMQAVPDGLCGKEFHR